MSRFQIPAADKRTTRATTDTTEVSVSFGRGASAPLSACKPFRASIFHLIAFVELACVLGRGKHYVYAEQGLFEKYSKDNLQLSDIGDDGFGSTQLMPTFEGVKEINYDVLSNAWLDGFDVDLGGGERYVQQGMTDFVGWLNAQIPGLALQIRAVTSGTVKGGDQKRGIVADIRGNLPGGSTAQAVLARCNYLLDQIAESGMTAPSWLTDAIGEYVAEINRRLNPNVEKADVSAVSDEVATTDAPDADAVQADSDESMQAVVASPSAGRRARASASA